MGLEFGIKDIIDILLVGTMMYWTFKLLKRSGAANLFWGILMIFAAWFLVSNIFNLELTGAIFDRIISVGAIALIIIFQEELRNLIYRFGSRLSIRTLINGKGGKSTDDMARQIVTACQHMSQTKTGALIVISGQSDLREFSDTGEYIHATISSRLIENIFFKNTPLHDGALIVAARQLVSAACILPVSKNTEIPQHYGLRHRAALGISEKTDATSIIVSEETGHISIAQNGHIQQVTTEELLKITTEALI